MSAVPESFRRIEEDWKPEPMTEADTVTALPASVFEAILDQPNPVRVDGDPLPPLWHWFLFPPAYPQAALGEDGHPADAAFTPPLAGRRRMFGGGRLRVSAPLRCGDAVVRRSSLASVRTREGGSGWLLLVTVRHEFSVSGQVRMTEEQDLIYRQPARPGPAVVVPSAGVATPAGPWSLELRPDPVLLFRFSALTHNAHRIHYDREYTTGVEGHPGLVVHGPLLALLLLELPRRFAPGAAVASFSWRARRPLFDHELVRVVGGPNTVLAAATDRAAEAVTGEVTLESQ
jgi:hydroxyacyl-ACP dehydratase HTD2-like protein with hotdog domain